MIYTVPEEAAKAFLVAVKRRLKNPKTEEVRMVVEQVRKVIDQSKKVKKAEKKLLDYVNSQVPVEGRDEQGMLKANVVSFIRTTERMAEALASICYTKRSMLSNRVFRRIGFTGSEQGLTRFFEGLESGWKLTLRRRPRKDSMGREKQPWMEFYTPIETFDGRWKGAKVTFDWVALKMTITGKGDMFITVPFQEGRRHTGEAPSAHPQCRQLNDVCMGQADDGVASSARNWDIMTAYAWMRNMLTHPNYNDSYYKPESFFNIEGARCKECGWWYVMDKLKQGEKCLKCGCYVCPKCIRRKIRNKSLISPCPQCNEKWGDRVRTGDVGVVCKSCIDDEMLKCMDNDCSGIKRGSTGTIVERRFAGCRKHVYRCDPRVCNSVLCEECATKHQCKLCGKYVCSDCIDCMDKGYCKSCSRYSPRNVELHKKSQKEAKENKKQENKDESEQKQ